MRALRMLCLAGCATAGGLTVSTATAEEVWSLSGFQAPESVVFDAERNVLYVSNVGGAPNDKDGNGFISKVTPEGAMETAEWVTGLDAPKGMVLSGSTLYVSDIDRLVAIDVEAGTVSGTWVAEGAQFLNDTAVDDAGRVYVSDMLANRIYVLENDALTVWAEGENLMHPNGLHAEGGTLTIAAWGTNIKEDFSTEAPGSLVSVDLNSKAVSPAGSGVGNLDGLEPDGSGGWYTTDWVAGALYHVDSAGVATQLEDLNQGSADLEFVADQKLVIVPMMMDGTVVAHSVE